MRCALLLGVTVLLLAACKREERRFEAPPPTQPVDRVRMSPLRVGGSAPNDAGLSPPPGYDESAYAINEGQRLFGWFNCTGCHAHGGGAIGPALMDARWTYGSEPENVFDTIAQGRPNGMPSFGSKIPEQQIWQLVAYVRSLSGLTPADARPARDEHVSVTPPPTLRRTEEPTGQPPEAPPP